MTTTLFRTTAAAAVLALIASAAAAHGQPGQRYGGGWPGHGPGYGGMMGPGQGYRAGTAPCQGYGGMMGQGYGMMGPGMMGPGMMGPGMMGRGMMQGGMMGAGPAAGQSLPRDLSADDARHLMQHRIDRMGMPNLTLGEVTERDDDTIVADIVTGDGALVQRMAIDRHTGQMRPAKEEEAN